MSMQNVGLGTVLALGRPLEHGLGIPGPYGNIPQEAVAAGSYEITGTQVALRAAPGLNGGEIGRFNNEYGDNGGKVAGVPDQVSFNGQTADADGLRWASVVVTSGVLTGKTGYVAMKYMAPVGWTASHGGTGPVPQQQGGNGGADLDNVSVEDKPVSFYEKYKTPIVIGGVAAGLLIVGAALMHHGKKKRSHSMSHAHAGEARRRRRRRRR